MGKGIPLEEFDRGGAPGRRLFIRQPALPATRKDFGGSSTGRFDQSAAFVDRQPPECRQVVFKECGFGM